MSTFSDTSRNIRFPDPHAVRGTLRSLRALAGAWVAEKVSAMLHSVRKALEEYAVALEGAALAAPSHQQTRDVQYALRDLRQRLALIQNNLILGRASVRDVVAFVGAGADLWVPQIQAARDPDELAETIIEAVDYVHDFLVGYDYIPPRLGFVATIEQHEPPELRQFIERRRQIRAVQSEDLAEWARARAHASDAGEPNELLGSDQLASTA